jgi:hypothetical protein
MVEMIERSGIPNKKSYLKRLAINCQGNLVEPPPHDLALKEVKQNNINHSCKRDQYVYGKFHTLVSLLEQEFLY